MDIDHKLSNIDWTMLSKFIERYKMDGYQYVELPWIIPLEYPLMTFNESDRIHQTQTGALIGSSEQSFIMKDYNGLLGKGKFISCSPCFRMEPVLDITHQEHFMKVELYVNDDTSNDNYLKILDNALHVFNIHSGLNNNPYIVETNDGHDIMLNDIEIGSYGIREYEHIKWIYGTVIAEPRFSLAKNIHGY